ncbi:glycoside hydrolase family 6 protein [Mycolicibacterium brumae]|uniref:Glucanase n=1 Tax=Mycolicibacterium brumae TaxID=85968 RepID=A0A2G5PG69_9MYCO|nr:glycoside hydrolase family 6 protein [Mycolicibacterium brumae]MCV7194355.1 glycoside hydrolase family 6 protein [Mycolicibacterium brumae]PIB77311.1 1,4-beta-glucanase [Mycolicibacterium brumae]RWA15495.1 hypothetical protein MBRU_10620 [Mycolicibacterium brumae DSM 44177]UWW10608.1 glycoside hydrolase family 6 protein [Mycolicibacterium brumae]
MFSALARRILPALAVATVVAAGLVSEPSTAEVRLASDANPLAGRTFYVDPDSKAMRAAQSSGSPEIQAIADVPQAFWLDHYWSPSSVTGFVSRYTGAALDAGATPIFAIYGIPNRDCGSYAAGGFGSGDSYRAWIDGIADGIGGAPVTIILEPDAIAMASCLSEDQRQERYGLLRYATQRLTQNPAAAVYIDAGHPRWISVEDAAAGLNASGVEMARGFSLNPTNYYTTEENIGYGEAISGLTGGKNYVIDTSRNGNGPLDDSSMGWCNPPGRALGVTPTTATAGPHADAYLWIKRVGESDGSCGGGAPAAGVFVNQFAIDLARNAGW